RLPEVESIRPSQAQSSKSVRSALGPPLSRFAAFSWSQDRSVRTACSAPIIINLSLDTNRSSSFGRTGNAYDVRFSPGGSSGGIVTAIAANMAVQGNGTDT